MKKLLGISFVAMLAVSPMMAMADPTHFDGEGSAPGTGQGAAVPPFETVDATASTNVATTSYVKGAYNDAIKAINAVNASIGTTVSGKQAQLVNDANPSANIDSSVKTTIAATAQASDTKLVTEHAIADALDDKQNVIDANNLLDVQYVNGALTSSDIADFATKEGVVATINHATTAASGTVTVYTTWNDETNGHQNLTISTTGTVTSPATNAYYATIGAGSGTTQTDTTPAP